LDEGKSVKIYKSLAASGVTFKDHRQVPVSIFMVKIAASFIFPKEFFTCTATNLKAENLHRISKEKKITFI
jgi:hypothetical protein